MAIKVQPSKFIWLNGKFIKWNQAKTHIITHSLHYGSGIFEGIRFYETEKGPAVFRLKDHMKRFNYSAKTIKLDLKYSVEELCRGVLKLIQKNNLKQGYIRPLCVYGEGYMGLDPTGAPNMTTIAAWPWGAYLSEESIKAHISKIRRLTPQQTDMRAKLCGHYFNSILASQEAHSLGFQEAILLDQEGNIAEGPGENIFMVKNRMLITPPEKFILPGITRDSIIKIAKYEKIPVKEKKITPAELLDADEAFFTGTAVEVSIINEIDGHKMKNPDALISKKLKTLYEEAARGENKKYKKWLTQSTSHRQNCKNDIVAQSLPDKLQK